MMVTTMQYKKYLRNFKLWCLITTDYAGNYQTCGKMRWLNKAGHEVKMKQLTVSLKCSWSEFQLALSSPASHNHPLNSPRLTKLNSCNSNCVDHDTMNNIQDILCGKTPKWKMWKCFITKHKHHMPSSISILQINKHKWKCRLRKKTSSCLRTKDACAVDLTRNYMKKNALFYSTNSNVRQIKII